MSDQEPKITNLRLKVRPLTDGSPFPSIVFRFEGRRSFEEGRGSFEEGRGSFEGVSGEEATAYLNKWAPPGATRWYSFTIQEQPDSGRTTIEASLTLPGVDSWEISEARVSRIGGRSQDDAAFQAWLYAHIGAATVAGGRIEAAMKRLILSMSGTLDPAFADAEDQWVNLEKKLRAAALTKGERAADIVTALDWGQQNKMRETRNDIVHAYWWDYAGVGITRGRVHRDGTSELILMTAQQLAEDVAKLQRYADTLDSAMDDKWLNIYLPRAT